MTRKRTLLACLLLMAVACEEEDGGPHLGFAKVTWEIRDEATMEPRACGSGDLVRVALTSSATDFACSAGRGTTSSIREGRHSATVDLVDPEGMIRSTTTFDVIIGHGTTTDMGLVQFLVN